MANTQRSASAIRGLYGIADADATSGDPLRMARALLAGGCRLLQLRCKGWEQAAVEQAATELLELARPHDATVILNDHVRIAARVAAHGVHLGQGDMDPVEARKILGPGPLLGLSTNLPEQLRTAAPHADYLAFGPVYSTRSAGRPKTVRGLPGLAVARELAGELPLVAIGGIDAPRVAEVVAAGADSWAVIGAIAHAADPVQATRELLQAAPAGS